MNSKRFPAALFLCLALLVGARPIFPAAVAQTPQPGSPSPSDAVCNGVPVRAWATANRPSNPLDQAAGFNLSSGYCEKWQAANSSWIPQSPSVVNQQFGQTYVLQPSDCGNTVVVTNPGPITVTLFPTAVVNCPITVVQGGAGQINFVAGGSATLLSALSASYTLNAPGATVQLEVLSNPGGVAAAWTLSGNGAAYSGPGDIMASVATPWVGLRGYSNAVALTGTQKAVNLRRASDGVACDFLVATNGALGLSTAACNSSTQGGLTTAAFGGIDASCSGTIVGVTATLTGCSSTPTPKDTLSGAGLSQPAWVVSCGSFTAGAGTCTLNAPQIVGTSEPLAFSVALFVPLWYDQSGANLCSGSVPCNLPQTTSGNQPQFLPNCGTGTGTPCIFTNGTTFFSKVTLAAATVQPVSYSTLAQRIGSLLSYNALISQYNGTGGGGLDFNNNGPNVLLQESNFITLGALDLAWHAIEATADGATLSLNVDGLDAVGNAGAFAGGATLQITADNTSNDKLNGFMFEAGFWQGATTLVQRNGLCANQNNWYHVSLCAATTPVFSGSGPCDVITGGCAEAWSVTRRVISSYAGPLLRLSRGTSTLDIGQVNGVADMSTWSAFCGGVAANCLISKIYAEINPANNLIPATFNAPSGPNCSTGGANLCAAPFAIDSGTLLPIVNTVAPYEYVIANDAGAQGVNGGTSAMSIMYSGKPVLATTQCCGAFGIGHAYNVADTEGTAFYLSLAYGQFSNPVGNQCATSSTYCFGADEESIDNLADYSASQWQDAIATISFNPSGGGTVSGFINGRPLLSVSPPAHALNVPTSVHLGGGADLSQPAPAIAREMLITNTALSAGDNAALFANEKSFYTNLVFP